VRVEFDKENGFDFSGTIPRRRADEIVSALQGAIDDRAARADLAAKTGGRVTVSPPGGRRP
jgi:hypothetical protein